MDWSRNYYTPPPFQKSGSAPAFPLNNGKVGTEDNKSYSISHMQDILQAAVLCVYMFFLQEIQSAFSVQSFVHVGQTNMHTNDKHTLL